MRSEDESIVGNGKRVWGVAKGVSGSGETGKTGVVSHRLFGGDSEVNY